MPLEMTERKSMPRRSARHPWAGQPGRLVIHDDPYDILAKLNWEANEFHLKRSDERPIEFDGMVYLLQNACISAVAVVEWLRLAATQSARQANRPFAREMFESAVDAALPDLPLAQAVANTFKHGEYRDTGLGNVEIRLESLFTRRQLARLAAAQNTERFDDVYEEQAAEADYQLIFTGADHAGEIQAEQFVLGLAHGALRLLDSTYPDLERFISPS
jgi:hypothetical protein